MRKRINTGYYFAEGVRNIGSHGLMSFAAVCMIVACLIIMGSFSLVAINADRMLGQLESENEFLVYIDETYTDAQIQALGNQIMKVDNVASITFISREEAKATYLEGHTGGLYETLPDQVFRDRYAVHVTDLDQFEQTVNKVAALPGVVNHRAESDIANGFVMVRNVASALASVLVVILVVIALFIIANTVKLAAFTRRDEIAIMKMCGATNWFVRWPFVFEGLILGILGAVVAFFCQWGIYEFLYNAVEASGAMTLFPLVVFRTIARPVAGMFLLVGGLIGGLGSVLAIDKFLKV